MKISKQMTEAVANGLDQVLDVAIKNRESGQDVVTAIGSVELNGIEFQIQLVLTANVLAFLGENDVSIREVNVVGSI